MFYIVVSSFWWFVKRYIFRETATYGIEKIIQFFSQYLSTILDFQYICYINIFLSISHTIEILVSKHISGLRNSTVLVTKGGNGGHNRFSRWLPYKNILPSISQILCGKWSKSWCLIIWFLGQWIQLYRLEMEQMAVIFDFQDGRHKKRVSINISASRRHVIEVL